MSAVVHIGFHKTGSTALQRQFFPGLPGHTLLTHGGRGAVSTFRLLIDNLLLADDDDFLEDTIRTYLEETRRRSKRPLIISHEGLSGQIFSGAYNRDRNAIRLRAVLPDAKILVVVRDQRTMLRSVYLQHLRSGGFAAFREFIDNEALGYELDLDHFRYDTLVTRYRELFGADRVLVLAYENLLSDSVSFLRAVRTFAGADAGSSDELTLDVHGRSFSPISRWLVRRNNRLFRKSPVNPKPKVRAIKIAKEVPRVLQDHVDPRLFRNARRRLSRADEARLERLLPRYEDSNAALECLTGLPLRELGYPAPARPPVRSSVGLHAMLLGWAGVRAPRS